MWSEHCSYKSSRVHLKTLPTEGPQVLQGPGENAGAVDIGEWTGGGLQDRVAQPSVVHRAVSGRRDRCRRHHPRHLHDGRAADRADELVAIRIAVRARHVAADGRRRRRYRRLRQQHRHSDHRRRDRIRAVVRRQSARECLLSWDCETVRHHQGRGVRRRQRRLLRRRQDRPRWHPRRDDGIGGVRREIVRETPRRSSRRSVHGEAAARGLPRGDADRHARSVFRTWAPRD